MWTIDFVAWAVCAGAVLAILVFLVAQAMHRSPEPRRVLSEDEVWERRTAWMWFHDYPPPDEEIASMPPYHTPLPSRKEGGA